MGEGRLGVKVVGMEARFICKFVDLTLKPQIFCIIIKQNLNVESNPWNSNMKWASAPGSVSSRWHLTARSPFERHQAEESPEAHGSQPARFSQAVHISPQICIQ